MTRIRADRVWVVARHAERDAGDGLPDRKPEEENERGAADDRNATWLPEIPCQAQFVGASTRVGEGGSRRRPERIEPGTLSRAGHALGRSGTWYAVEARNKRRPNRNATPARRGTDGVRHREWIPPAKPALQSRALTRRGHGPMRGSELQSQPQLKQPEPRPKPNTRAKRGVPTESAQTQRR